MISLMILLAVKPASAWSNGSYTTDINNPGYGTHDWIAQHALDNLPTTEKQYILNNLNLYLYGTELPDNSNAILGDGIGDTAKHHVYYYANGQLQDDSSAKRANQTYQQALAYLKAQDYPDAAKTAGTMTHYIADLGVWAHVMGANTDWGAEPDNVHSNYESYVNTRTSAYIDTYNIYLSYDGNLDFISAYNATLNLANDTTFDNGGIYTCVWMNNSYSTTNQVYWNRAGQSLNLAVNAVSDVLHTLYVDANQGVTPTPTPSPSATASPTPTPSASPTPTPTSTPSPTPSPSPSPSPSPTPTQVPTATPTQAPTQQPTTQPTIPPTQAPIITVSPTQPTPTRTPTPKPTPITPEYSTILILIILIMAITTLAISKRFSSVTHRLSLGARAYAQNSLKGKW